MNQYEAMFQSHPQAKAVDFTDIIDCIQACLDCEVTCSVCADACLSEADPSQLAECIRLNLDCAEICGTTARMLCRRPGSLHTELRIHLEGVLNASRRCGEECRKHASHHEHCRICADTCRACVESCERLLSGSLAAAA